MIPETRSFQDSRNPIGVLILLAAFAVAAGCSTANTTGGGGDVVVNHVNESGNSVPGWVAPTGGSHANSATMNYIANGGSSSCTECHGSDLTGGISRVSCFGNPAGCHHAPIAGWVTTSPATQNHGVSAKKAPGSSGFDSCRICHGNNFAGTASVPSCLNNAACHGVGVVSPHPPKPWRAGAGSLYDHVTTDSANASVCYDCHAYTGTANPNNPHVPPTPAPVGTAPGCTNGTMCHNQAGHTAGWAATSPAPQPHGDAAKKDGTVAGQGFPSCQTCHGDNFAGGSVSVSCFTCHGVNAPHAPKPWRGSPYTHTTAVEAGNAPVCYTCHAYTGSPNPRNPHDPPTPAPGGTAPGCFNGTMCHNQASHAVPFFDNTAHTQATTASFSSDCGSCHAVTGTSPVSSAPLCTSCHITDPRDVTNCTSCHANPPSGASTAYPNVGGAHSTHIALDGAGTPVSCSTCHDGLGSGTLSHYDRTRPTRVSPASVAFVTTYNAKTGSSAFDNSSLLRCTNVSCHGGQATPNWQTGSITATTQCTSCHASGTGQFNSYNSGEHSRHSGGSFSCTECHDMDVATNNTTGVIDHFQFLGTSTMEGPAKDTFRNSTGTVVYTPGGTAGTGTCTGTCHSKNHSAESW